jgi:nitrogen fixation protein FixH
MTMKTMLAVTALTLTGGMLVGGTQVDAASAACSPYAGTVKTSTSVNALNTTSKSSTTITVRVRADSGNGKPAGTVDVTLTKPSGAVKQTFSGSYSGSSKTFKTAHLKGVGTWTLKSTYAGGSCSIFKKSSGTGDFKVK